MRDVTAVILGGGQGSRLYPLTKDRSKPAVPLAGKYRLIDIPISNCINSNIRQIHVLTMFQSASLNAHVSSTYRFDAFSRGFVEILAAEQTRTGGSWFQGTADAVRQAWMHIHDRSCERVLILSGDHLYRMNYRDFERVHLDAAADLSIAVQPVTREEAPELGLLKIDETGRIVQFAEKPSTPEALAAMEVDTTTFGLSPEEARRRPFLASMGIYLFNAPALGEALHVDVKQTDFGKHIIPQAIKNRKVQAYCFNGYWADIGTVGAFYQANMDLVQPLPRFNLFDPVMPIYTHPRNLPCVKLNRASVEGALLAEGCIIDGGMVRDSILGVRTLVKPGATIENSYIMGADEYQPGNDSRPRIGVGEGAYVKRAIIDKNTSIGRGVQLVNRNNVDNYDDPEGRFFVRDGVLLTVKNAVIPDGFVF